MELQLRKIVERALEEDIGWGDITTRLTVPDDTQARGVFLAKAQGIIAGLDVARAAFDEVEQKVEFRALVGDGDHVTAGMEIASVSGPARGILTAERVALNFLQRMSGIATLTAQFVEKVRGTRAHIVDTRKTTPGLRRLEKSAVRTGGGHNHRFGLSDGILIKDNHIAAAGGIAKAVSRARDGAPHTMKIQVEARNLDELHQAITAHADAVLLDNMTPKELRNAVEAAAGKVTLEASGGVSLETVREIAESGVDLISVGALTHSAPALDISLIVASG